MALLGDDGQGYELARKLESCGVWRSWLGDSLHSHFVQYLTSSSSWESFMRADESKSRAQLQIQLRARALLFDKATVSLFLRPQSSPSISSNSLSSSSVSISKLNPNYLQLHGDDVYFTLEDGVQRDGVAAANASSKGHQKTAFGVGSRYNESELDSMPQRFMKDDLPEIWYNQFIEKYRSSRPYMLPSPDRVSVKRTPTEMFNYLKLLENHKRRRMAFKEDQYAGFGSSVLDGNSSGDEVPYFFPESMFMMNCVPDCAIKPRITEEKPKLEFYGVLDTLPQVATKSSIMLERLGIRPESLNMEQGPGKSCSKVVNKANRKQLSQDQALQLSKKVIARLLQTGGFEGATEIPIEVLSQLLSCHICKLSHMLKVLADSYRKQCSATELLKMFLHTAGYGNLAALSEYVKDGRNFAQPTAHQVQGIQSQLVPTTQQNHLQMPQQSPRQIHPQMQQTVHPRGLTFQQQQLMRIQRQQVASPRLPMTMDKDAPMVQVKLENPSDLPMDSNTFCAINNRNQQMHYRQQQFAAFQRLQAQSGSSGNQLRQLASLPTPQMQTQNVGAVRAPPVKVEGFQELIGGDTSLKHDADGSKMTSPSK